MAGKIPAIVLKELELRSQALAANIAEIPHLEVPRQLVAATVAEMKSLTAQQASLTAAKQGVSKRLAALNRDAQKLLTFVDVGVRQHYGNRSEKLVEFGQQPFRSRPRIKLVEVDGEPVEPSPTPAEPPAPPVNE
ncbi:MAG TPA: hypothetical protein VEW48_27020 [Thermoanaerobaculia bacterium]|nr:hypothetical protein [Thermoanaerobaculia bacterium]